MKRLKQLVLATVVAFGIATSACGDSRMTSETVKMMIKSELAVGASSQDIESFFKKHNLPYTYDRFTERYQSIIRNVSSDPKVDEAIVIYLYVDDEKRFIREEVRSSFTAP